MRVDIYPWGRELGVVHDCARVDSYQAEDVHSCVSSFSDEGLPDWQDFGGEKWQDPAFFKSTQINEATYYCWCIGRDLPEDAAEQVLTGIYVRGS